MKRIFFGFSSEPQEQVYRDLIDLALSVGQCKYAFLIVREKIPLDQNGNQALEDLNPHIETVKDVSEWPGTKLHNQTAKLYSYRFDQECAAALKTIASRLYEWEQPHLPEDLGLMLDETAPWLFTIAHERDAVLCLTDDELGEIQKNQRLASMIIKDQNLGESN